MVSDLGDFECEKAYAWQGISAPIGQMKAKLLSLFSRNLSKLKKALSTEENGLNIKYFYT